MDVPEEGEEGYVRRMWAQIWQLGSPSHE